MIKRAEYLDKLISKKHNGLIKIITDEKRRQEERPLVSIHDSFKKIIVVKDNIMLKRDENGITTMGLKEFILNKDSLDL